MKECAQCKKQYDDQLSFCPSCGGQLAPVQAEQTVAEPAPKAPPKAWEAWMPVFLGIGGFIISWYVWDVLGGVTAVCGAVMGWKSDKPLVKWISLLLGISVGTLSLYSMFQ